MRFTLVERQDARIRSVPDLGVAHLLGQCKAADIKATLVQGSPETLACLKDNSVRWLFEQGYKDAVKQLGEKGFKEFLKFNYGIATSDEIADKTNPDAISDMWQLLTYMREMVWPAWLPEHIFTQIEKSKPDVVGFSMWDFYDHPGICAALKKVMQRVRQELRLKVIIGGPGTVTKKARADLMAMFSPDFIIHHEGEAALPELLRMIEAGRIAERPNISFRNWDGETKPVEDLDSLAFPDFTQCDLDSFFLPVRVLPLMTARGCEWARCAFCNHHATYTGYREHSPEYVAQLITHYKKKYGAEMMMFHDETLSARRARILADRLPEAYYYSYAYPKGYDFELLKKMHEAGFRVLVWGVESGCQNVLNSMRKGTNTAEVEQVIRDSYHAGITNVAFIMFGFPGETREQALETVEFLRRNSQYIERHSSTAFRLEEESPVGAMPDMWGVKRVGKDYRVRKGMQREEVKQFLKEMNTSGVKTSADTKYYMPGDSEFRAYLFMQAVYGEGGGDYPVRNGIIVGNEIWPSLLMKGASRPKVKLSPKQLEVYKKCDGSHRADAKEFVKYPYVVFYNKKF